MRRGAAAALALSLTVAACSGDDDDGDADATATDENGGESELDALRTEIEELQTTVEQQTTELDELAEQVTTAEQVAADAQAELTAETQRADDAEASLADLQARVDEFTANFPATITASLDGYENELIGAYTLVLTEAFCDALPTCGTQRPEVRADIIQGPNGLQLQVPNVFTTGLFLIEGSLFGVTDSNQILPACPDGTPVNAQVSTTIFADGVDIELDGTRTLSGLGASVLVAANPAGDCGPGNVFFSGTLTPA